MYGGIKRFINVSTDEVYGESSYGMDTGVALCFAISALYSALPRCLVEMDKAQTQAFLLQVWYYLLRLLAMLMHQFQSVSVM